VPVLTGSLPPLPPLKPLFDYPLRDTSICLGPDGVYYLTGTTGAPDWWAVTGDIKVWKSADLKEWTPLIIKPRLRTTVWNIDRDGTWEKPIGLRDGAPFRPLWAPEIQYLKGTFWISYSIPHLGSGLLKSATGKAEGPYVSMSPEKPLADNIDASLFQDDDGKVYYVYGNGKIARMKEDMTGFAEPPRQLSPAGAGRVGFEGTFLFKANGKYHLTGAEFVNGDYHCYAAFADKLYGPYSERYLAIPHAGHNTLFKDKDGNWWATFFGNSARAPFRERPAMLRIEFTPEGRIRPLIGH